MGERAPDAPVVLRRPRPRPERRPLPADPKIGLEKIGLDFKREREGIMKRYSAYDPPEYLDWAPDEALVGDYAARLQIEGARASAVAALGERDFLALYRDLLRTRLHDIALKRWVRQGVISKAWLGTGEEAVTVGAVFALDAARDVVSPMIRNAGALHMMGMSLASMFRGYLATEDSPSRGRDIHIGDLEKGIIQPISHMGTNVPVMAGVALSFRNRGEDRVALTWIGDGATKTGECHEGINFAAVRNLPVVYVLQNNQVALGTRAEQHGAGDLAHWPEMYGIPGWECDGNNLLEMYAVTRQAVELCRRGKGPGMIVAQTFRMGGHATHDEREARATFPDSLFREWGRRDPVGLYEAYLMRRGIARGTLEGVEAEVTAEVEAAAEEALTSRERVPPPESAMYEGFTQGGTLLSLERRPL